MELPDRISVLPEPIIHSIMTLLPRKSIKSARSLSRTWYDFSSSFPYFDFCDSNFDSIYDDDEGIEYLTDDGEDDSFHPCLKPGTEIFFNYITKILSRFHDRNPRIPIRRIRIEVALTNSRLVLLLSDWIRLALDHGVDKIDLESRGYWYNLPPDLFASNSIQVLKIQGTSLLDSFHHRDDNSVSCSKLRKLVINRVCIDELALTSVILNCPLIEKLEIKDVTGLRILRISGLYMLKSLVVNNYIVHDVKMIEVDAPMLHCLDVSNTFGGAPIKIGTFDCLRLAELTLRGVEVGNIQLEEILSRLLVLRSLRLTKVCFLTKFKITSDSLNELAISSCEHLVELEINAPNLLRFTFHSHSVPLMSPLNTKIMGQSDITLEVGWEPNFAFEFMNFISQLNCVKELYIKFQERAVGHIDIDGPNLLPFEFDSNSAPLVTGKLYVNLEIGEEPLLFDNFSTKFRKFLSWIGWVNHLYIYLKHFEMISVDQKEECIITDVEELYVVVQISKNIEEIFIGLLRSYHPRILTMSLKHFKNSGLMTFLEDINAGVGPCCSWLPYLEEITFEGAVAGRFSGDVIRLPMDGTPLPSIDLERYFWADIKFVFKW